MHEHQSFHERIDQLFAPSTWSFLDKMRVMYAEGNPLKILGLQPEKPAHPAVENTTQVTEQPAAAATHLEQPQAAAMAVDASAEPMKSAEKPVGKRHTIAEYLQKLRQQFATGAPIFTNLLAQSAQTA